MGARTFVDDERRAQVCEWLESHGLDPAAIPLGEPMTATPINEGTFQVDYQRYDDAPGFGYTQHRVALVDTAPPGYEPHRSLVWNSRVYLFHLEYLPEGA